MNLSTRESFLEALWIKLQKWRFMPGYKKPSQQGGSVSSATLFHAYFNMFSNRFETNVKKASGRTKIVELEKNQGQIWNQWPLKVED